MGKGISNRDTEAQRSYITSLCLCASVANLEEASMANKVTLYWWSK